MYIRNSIIQAAGEVDFLYIMYVRVNGEILYTFIVTVGAEHVFLLYIARGGVFRILCRCLTPIPCLTGDCYNYCILKVFKCKNGGFYHS